MATATVANSTTTIFGGSYEPYETAVFVSPTDAAFALCACLWDWPEWDGDDSPSPDYYCDPACIIHGAHAFE